MYLLTAGSFVLDVNGFLQGAAHGSHLAGTAVALAVGAAHRIGCLRASLRALAHWLIILDHAHRPVIAHLIHARAGYSEIWPKRCRAEALISDWFPGMLRRGWREFLGLGKQRGRLERSYTGGSGVRGVGRWWNLQHSPIPVTLQLPRLPVSLPCLSVWCLRNLWRDRQNRHSEDCR